MATKDKTSKKMIILKNKNGKIIFKFSLMSVVILSIIFPFVMILAIIIAILSDCAVEFSTK